MAQVTDFYEFSLQYQVVSIILSKPQT